MRASQESNYLHQCFIDIDHAIQHSDYCQLRAILSRPEFDINQATNESLRLDNRETTLNSPLEYARYYENTPLLELFLWMGANPGVDNNRALTQVTAIETETFLHVVASGKFTQVRAILDSGFVYTDHICRTENGDTALFLAVKSGSLDTVKLLLARGGMISDQKIRDFCKKHSIDHHANDGYRSIIKLLQLEKQKQIAMMDIFIYNFLEMQNPENFKKTIKCIKHEYDLQVLNCSTLLDYSQWESTWDVDQSIVHSMASHTNFINIFSKIKDLYDYGITLKNSGNEVKGQRTLDFVRELRIEIMYYIIRYNKNPQDDRYAVQTDRGTIYSFQFKFDELMNKGQRILGEDRNISDILAHIILAFTGIGLLLMTANKICYGSFFLTQTERQKKLNLIKNAQVFGDFPYAFSSS